MKPIFIIEHLEKEVYPWCLIEYRHISKIVRKKNLWFTNLKGKKGAASLSQYGRCITESVRDLNLKNACVLDPAATKTLVPAEARRFSYFVFGGILGDYPPKQRTKQELTPLLPEAKARNIWKEQMSTDNAVLVVSEIIRGEEISSLSFQDSIEIKIDAIASVQLPYRYHIINKKPFISPALTAYLKKKKGI